MNRNSLDTTQSFHTFQIKEIWENHKPQRCSLKCFQQLEASSQNQCISSLPAEASFPWDSAFPELGSAACRVPAGLCKAGAGLLLLSSCWKLNWFQLVSAACRIWIKQCWAYRPHSDTEYDYHGKPSKFKTARNFNLEAKAALIRGGSGTANCLLNWIWKVTLIGKEVTCTYFSCPLMRSMIKCQEDSKPRLCKSKTSDLARKPNDRHTRTQ